ncbi:MAG: phosphoenolpyruvate carboxykinase (ATP) [Candidatus Zipacnadales bacterium]
MPTASDTWRDRLAEVGLTEFGELHWNATTGELYEHAVRRREATIAHMGPLVVNTGQHRGRTPNDKFIVRDALTDGEVWWEENQEFTPEAFARLFHRLKAYLRNQDLFVQDCYVCAHPKYQIPLRIITQKAWHNLFARNMFLRIFDRQTLLNHRPEFTVIHGGDFRADREQDGTNSGAFIIINFSQKLCLIGGTQYGGEIKKSVFTILNYLLPAKRVLSMHCSANVGQRGDVALFFGLSGTGKTTLSADPERRLIGDDEHGWCDDGIFNFEGGCYAKVIRLSREAEPTIYECTRRFGTILENVAISRRTRRIDLNDDAYTENTRAAYPVSYMGAIVENGCAGHPQNIIFLTCDADGVMPPVAKLTYAQALYHFLSGYTANTAGVEAAVKDTKPVFSPCFGAPFLARPPQVYAEMLGERMKKHRTKCWLINTGWIGGPWYQSDRIEIRVTRAIIRAILSGDLAQVETIQEPIFGLQVPKSCPGVPPNKLMPRNNWRSKKRYDETATMVAKRFHDHFAKRFPDAPPDILKGGPLVR